MAGSPDFDSAGKVRPRATYRLQLSPAFTFDDARLAVPYLSALGISHVYVSPIFKARSGSPHGYDGVDYTELNPELGGMEGFRSFVRVLQAYGLGLIVDFVPNHMAASDENPWWSDVLEWGPRSDFASYFDIDWDRPEPFLNGKLALPFLGDHFKRVFEFGELQLHFDARGRGFGIRYYEHWFPVAPTCYAMLLRRIVSLSPSLETVFTGLIATFSDAGLDVDGANAGKLEIIRRIQANPDVTWAFWEAIEGLNEPEHRAIIHWLLNQQHYRLAYWRTAAEELNYRRFFDITHLPAMRMELESVFEHSHSLLARLIAEGAVDGVRLDHVDGLYDPEGYFQRLRQALPRGDNLYIVVEKILSHHEQLRRHWPVDGESGYAFLNLVNGVFVDRSGEKTLTQLYDTIRGHKKRFAALARAAKRDIMETTFPGEISDLAKHVTALAKQTLAWRDYTFRDIHKALRAVFLNYSVYRTYFGSAVSDQHDSDEIDRAVTFAARGAGARDETLFEFLALVLKGQAPEATIDPATVHHLAARVQQITGPIMAKAVEDTAFYRYARLLSLNDVGGEPDLFGFSPAEFHAANRDRRADWPDTMLATATHDHKRGEDVRARLNVLSEDAAAWAGRVEAWRAAAASFKVEVDGVPAPSGHDEYVLYQTLVGAWPMTCRMPAYEGLQAFADRVSAYMTKAAREAKLRTSWITPNTDYEAALDGFVRRVLDPVHNGPLLADICRYMERIAPAGAVNGLAQAVLKLTSPGVPDIYQGTESWDLSLVDPDNRRPVDFENRALSLESMLMNADSWRPMLAHWPDGRIKHYVLSKCLALRARLPDLFARGRYKPVEVSGDHADHVIAFRRRLDDLGVLVVVPRLVLSRMHDRSRLCPSAWAETAVKIPVRMGGPAENIFLGRDVPLEGGKPYPVGALLGEFPVAVLVTGRPA